MEKYFYHGTIDKFVPEILTEGLQPKKQNGWNAYMETFFGNLINPAKDDVPGFVYMTSDESWANRYAQGKAEYFRAEPGTVFTIGSLEMRKAPDAPVIPDAVGTILRIKASSQIYVNLVRDERDSLGRKFHGNIPPELIEVDTNTPEPLKGLAAELS